MKFKIKYDLFKEQLPEEEIERDQIVKLIDQFPWEDKYQKGEEEIYFPSIEIINETDKRLLIVTAMDKKAKLLYVIESLFVGKLARGKTGDLIKDAPKSTVLEVVELFTKQDYEAIKNLDNTGIFSKVIRKLTFLFATDD